MQNLNKQDMLGIDGNVPANIMEKLLFEHAIVCPDNINLKPIESNKWIIEFKSLR